MHTYIHIDGTKCAMSFRVQTFIHTYVHACIHTYIHTYRWYEVREELQGYELRTDTSIIEDLESARSELMDPFGNISNCLCVSVCMCV
jgi:hypothetical protein